MPKENICTYHHEQNILGPGSSWKREESLLLVPQHIATYNCLLSEKHYHVFVKYCFAKSLFESDQKNIHYWRDVYERMQIARIGTARTEKLKKLIFSFKEKGYQKKCPIPVSRDWDILDGSHRLAVSILLGLCPEVEVYDFDSHNYDKKWFIANGFSKEELEKIDQAKNKIADSCTVDIEKVRIGIVWGVSLGHWEGIIEIFSQFNIVCCFIYDFINEKNVSDFVLSSYKGDGMDEGRIKNKAKRLAERSTKIGIVIFNDQDNGKLVNIKNVIRAKYSPLVKDYFFDCILHLIDCRKTEIEIIENFKSVFGRLN